MPHGNIFSVNFICLFPCPPGRRQMGHDLVSEEVEIDPFGR